MGLANEAAALSASSGPALLARLWLVFAARGVQAGNRFAEQAEGSNSSEFLPSFVAHVALSGKPTGVRSCSVGKRVLGSANRGRGPDGCIR